MSPTLEAERATGAGEGDAAPIPLAERSPITAAPTARPSPSRLASLDAYRGFVMLLMASDALGVSLAARHFKESRVWQFLAYQCDHVQWVGCALWDLIQPSFSFIVGVAMPYSLASRRARGQSFQRLLAHALIRSLILIALGVFLRSMHSQRTNFTFEDTLTQIGLGYPFLFLLAWTRPRTQALALVGILVGYWLAFAAFPMPRPGFDFASVGVPESWPRLNGFAAHWDKNTNLAAAVDRWFLNLFPRPKPFAFNGGGYQTLSFIPTLATMILGLLAGNLLRSDWRGALKFLTFLIGGCAGLAGGYALDHFGICPSVKRIWTPAWVLFSGGWCCLLLATFYLFCDMAGWRRWAFPLTVVGMNSIAMYLLADGARGFVVESLRIHFGPNVFNFAGDAFADMVKMTICLIIFWLILWWMYRRKIFLRI